VQKIALAVPTRWAIDGLDAMTWRGLGMDAAAMAMAAQLAFAVVFAGLALYKFNRDRG
jgi:ABC-2 type transport system permease protein